MAVIDPNAKYGNTSPVKLCGEAHGVPADHTYAIADKILHGRDGYWYDKAHDWLGTNLSQEANTAFFKDLSEVTARAV